MTAVRSFTPDPAVYKRYRVTLLVNKYDTDEGKQVVSLHALSKKSARDTAEDSLKDRYPDALAVNVEADTSFHDDGCGLPWAEHDRHDPNNQLPFGCPSELEVRRRWGDR